MTFEEKLREAAQAKGSPLSDSEKITEYKAWEQESRRDELQERFIKVIRMAGYKNDAPERICAEYLDEYMKDIPGFVAMLQQYERDYQKDGEII